MSFLKNLNWRFATKKFDPNKKVSAKNIGIILEAIRLAPTSFGLQTFHVYVVSNKNVQKKMLPIAFMQSQIVDASHILICCGRNDVIKRINAYGKLIIEKNILDQLKTKNLQNIMKNAMVGKTNNQLMVWAQKQAYIALGFAIAACAELKIDSCPIEGFNAKEIDKLLKLPTYMHSVVMLSIGYRKEDPSRPKLRFPKEDLFSFIN